MVARRLFILCSVFLLLGSPTAARAAAPPITLSVSISNDRPLPGADFAAAIVVFDGSGDLTLQLDLPAGLQLHNTAPLMIHAAPVGLTIAHIHVASDAAVGARVLRFRAGGRVVTKQIYVGIFPWPAAQVPAWRLWMPLIRR